MKIIGVIPARYHSSRFEGKPLAKICGKPMIWWVYQQSLMVKDFEAVYVATDDDRIAEVCVEYGINFIMTSRDHKTGTDRVAEVSKTINADIYVVIMGDEPLVKSADIDLLISAFRKEEEAFAMMIKTEFTEPVDVVNPDTIKIATNNEGDIVYMSRSPIPAPKARINFKYYKNIGLYAFTPTALAYYSSTPIGFLEGVEEIELLRLIESGVKVKTITIDSVSMSVDTIKDLERINQIALRMIRDGMIDFYKPEQLDEVLK